MTRKLTLDYGLRYDYVTLAQGTVRPHADAAFDTPNPVAGDRLGTVIYEATCNCKFNHNYPWAFGPRLGAAYQINSKTVLRAGRRRVLRDVLPTRPASARSADDFYTIQPVGVRRVRRRF